ncbi:succinate dehydrogenase / fumarate reductase cytochrome b subunit [Granulicella aggregans]|uniref:Succinate dehydrogenase / fumarate reductase cytochrome b subunit n=1 Tax=Granulicella aggregans TaxID=474949 RepID=A0A7W7ZAF9_9BACT|nr:succinate dehydrogenase [Granulicella aggregans]MBB5056039.1 succinate dehydrogenase / fumarate reductase cytochrome b subunit [Granulicella aggregans]
MATVAPPVPSSSSTIRGVQPLRAGQGNSFLWRKLHSLSGIVPIGAFLVEHILSNFEAIHGPLAYAQQVKFLNSLPLVRVLEWAFIFIPLAFHAGYGVFIAFRGRSNVNVYPWAGNWMYISQRVTGLIAFVYIIQHVWRQRFAGVSLPDHPGAAFAKVQHELANPWMLAIYVIAMVATTWHFAYGIWLFAAKWGITPGEQARKKFGYVCAAIGIALCVMGLWGMWAFVGPQYQNAPADVLPAQSSRLVLPAPTDLMQRAMASERTGNAK